ncbi:hypothetical protein DPEC_G00164720 [Dallia pectoralis]|uniref:Uncharacterized protein n=1 Tax=Dallia pectoralis TaxID=75939 RepID=A0ACC2GHM6_DALPE|nr:hypothetical protein DPEC_G00164720 [Dallia pectoralis]
MERVTPAMTNPAFGEYDYVSDSDDECEPVKIASQGRLSQSSRCKYTYTKECKWRARSDRDSAAWRHESKECFEVKKAEDVSLSPDKTVSHQRLRRRGSRSSTSSEVSTSVSISGDSMNSPKSTDRTDSDCEKRVEIRRKGSSELRTYERSPQKICKESSTQLALTFTKSTKRYSADKTFLSTNKDNIVTSRIINSNVEEVDPASGLPKVRSAVKNLEKCRSKDVSSREKDISSSRATDRIVSPGKNTPPKTSVKASKGESPHIQFTSSDLKSHQFQSSHSPTNNEAPFLYNKLKKEETISAEESFKEREGSRSTRTHSEVSEVSTFDEHNNIIPYSIKEPITFTNVMDTKSTPLCGALMDEVCLSPTEFQEALTQKDNSHLIPFPLGQDQSLMKSPLSFDTTSMFEDLSVAEFDNGLYTDIPLNKEGFNPLEISSDKKELYSSSSFLCPFLEQRDWGLMDDVTPMLPEQISQYKDNVDKPNQKKSDYNHVPLSLPEKIMDYSVNLNSCVSEDELEIKRIVTELENQLQTTKLSGPELLPEESQKLLKMSKFSPLRLNDESENGDNSLDMCCPVQGMALGISSMPSNPQSEVFVEPGLPWSSTFEFELMDGHHTPTHVGTSVLEQVSKKDDQKHIILNSTSNADERHTQQEDRKEKGVSVDERTAIEKSEEILENKTYAENLMKSLEVISDSIYENESITPDVVEPKLTSAKSQENTQSYSHAPSAEAAESQVQTEANVKSTHSESKPALFENIELQSFVKDTVSLQSDDYFLNSVSKFKEMPMLKRITEDSSGIEFEYSTNAQINNPAMTEEINENEKPLDCEDQIRETKSDLPDYRELLNSNTDGHTQLSDATIDENQELLGSTISEHSVILDSTIDEHTHFTDKDIDDNTEILETTIDERPNIVDSTNDVNQERLDTTNNVNPELVDTTNDMNPDIRDANIDKNTKLLHTAINVKPEVLDSKFNDNTEILESTVDENQEPLNDNIDEHQQPEEPVEDIRLDTMSQPEGQEVEENIHNKPEEVRISFVELSINFPAMSGNLCHLPSANKQTEGGLALVTKEDNIEYDITVEDDLMNHTVPLSCSAPGNDISDRSNHNLLESLSNKLCNSLFVESSRELASRTSLFSDINSDDESTVLDIAVPVSDVQRDAHMEHKSDDKAEPVMELEAKHREGKEIPDFKDIQKTVPLHLMASPQHSPCKEDLPLGKGVFTGNASLSSPVSPASPHILSENPGTQDRSNSMTCENMATISVSVKNTRSTKEEICDAKEAVHTTNPMAIPAEMEYSLVSPPQLDLGITESKTSSTEACFSSSFPLTIATEPSEAMKALTKRVSVSLYDFKLSPLNPNYIPDEPPQLSQFDYTPISPANMDVEEEHVIKLRPNDERAPCDLGDEMILTSDQPLCDIATELPMSPDHAATSMDLTQSKPNRDKVKRTKTVDGVAEFGDLVQSDIGVHVGKDISMDYDTSRENLHGIKDGDTEGVQQTPDDRLVISKRKEVAVKTESKKNSGLTNEADIVSCFKSSPASPLGLTTEVNPFLDDESSFSELFPTRNEELKRKKCAKVYGKKNKKQKLSPISSLVQDYLPPDMYLEKRDDYTAKPMDGIKDDNDHCEYKTISIDDAIMLNMCHNSTLKSDSHEVANVKGDTTDLEDVQVNTVDGGSDFVCPLESTIDKGTLALSAFNNLDADALIFLDPTSHKSDAPVAPSTPPIITPVATYPGEPSATDNETRFHRIDIPNLNTTFQLPEITLFDTSKDLPLAEPAVTDNVPTKDTAKTNETTERKGRKRQEGSAKIKDKQYKCKVCFTRFLTLGELNFHKLSHNPSPPPTCYMCVQRKFSSREQLRDHLREKHAKNKAGTWTCGMCLKEISDVWMYNEHLREHATQFARKGQSHSAILGSLPGSGMQESAVKNFITSIMQRRPIKTYKESTKVPNKDETAIVETNGQETKTTEATQTNVARHKGNRKIVGKPSTMTPVEVLHKTETAPKNVEMHPNCKDPSRDCHHCGKQFPKPFKLQRHLVVHNLNKIFLCHKCPVTYQEPQELKDHVKSEHEEMDEVDMKHTTLYTCELCADVMHVIKKSFICSTCNYTFSKKEQFDRHMEKHLSGGNKIFKFRGVIRPIKTSKVKDECELPASKKRKILTDSLQDNSSDSGIASIASLHSNQSAEMQVVKPTVHMTEDSTQTNGGKYHTDDASVKTEDMAGDYSDVVERCSFHLGSEGLLTAMPKTEDVDPSLSSKLPLRDTDEADGKSVEELCDVKEEDHPIESSTIEEERECRTKQHGPEIIIETSTAETEERAQRRDSLASDEELYVSFSENLVNSSKISNGHDLPPTRHKSCNILMDQMRECEQGQQSSNTPSQDSRQKDKLLTPKHCENTKHSPRTIESTPVHHTKVTSQGLASSENKDSARREQKKRKETRPPHILQRVSSPATRENFGVDVKTKNKFRSRKCESLLAHRKSDGPSDYPVLSSMRDDVVTNKLISKHKTSGSLGLQPKRSSLDNCTPKKNEIVQHLNGDYKAKKGPLGRTLHFSVSKASAPPMNNSLIKSRPKTGMRSIESHSYRTAESQNNLLSQLFGQKLTSFKIPLRKDT